MPPGSLATRCAAALAGPRLPLWLALTGALLASPSVLAGWHIDDLFQRWILLKGGAWTGIAATPRDLFSFIDGDPERNRRLVDLGLFPWWTAEELRIRFFRPVSVLTHRLDYLLWPGSAPAMHLHSLAWFAAAIALAATGYRRLLGHAAAAGLAAVLFALDDAHGLPAGWIANRNSLIGLVFGLAALIAHQRSRSAFGRTAALWSPALFALALLSSESALACAGYLAAHAIFVDRAPWRERLRSLGPHLVVGALWLFLLRRFSYGAAGSGVYLDPVGDLGAYLSDLPNRILPLLLGQWGFPPSGVWASIDATQLPWMRAGAAVFIGLVVLFLLPVLRRSPSARFFAAGMAFSLLPVCATAPDDRLLLWSGFGAMGVAGEALLPFVTAFSRQPGAALTRALRGATAALLLLIHVVIAPLLLPLVARSMQYTEPLLQQPASALESGETLQGQDLIIVDHPLPFFAGYLFAVRELAGQPLPRALRVLAPGSGGLGIFRPDARTLVLRPDRGFFSSPYDLMFRSPRRPLVPGSKLALSGLVVSVGSPLANGRPDFAEFRFDVPLEDPSLRWCRWEKGAYVTFTPPPVGASIRLGSNSPFGRKTER